MSCDDVLAALALGLALDAETSSHTAACAACRARIPAAAAVRAALASDPEPEPPRHLTAALVAAAAPMLERNARRAMWARAARALSVALVPLPVILAVDVYLLQRIYGLLSAVLPETLSFYLVLDYALLVALLMAITYGAIPVLAERQARPTRGVPHG